MFGAHRGNVVFEGLVNSTISLEIRIDSNEEDAPFQLIATGQRADFFRNGVVLHLSPSDGLCVLEGCLELFDLAYQASVLVVWQGEIR